MLVQSNITTNATLDDFSFQCAPPVFEFHEVAQADISNAIDRLKSTQSSSVDGITANKLKSCKAEIIDPLMMIFNRSIAERTFPDI